MTYEEAIALLRVEISSESITDVARRYGIKRQRLSDILRGRARLSGEALTKLRFEIEELYRRIG
jgi:plasmid maintenance system antidote protein VapI